MPHRRTSRIAAVALLGGASLLSLSTAASAQSVLFSTSGQLPAGSTIEAGRDIAIAGETVQVRLPGGAVASFVDAAHFSLRGDGAIDLRSGSVTVVGASGSTTQVHMPDGVRGTVAGASAATFTANAAGARGSTTAGTASVAANGVTRSFAAGQFWTAAGNRAPDRVIAGTAAVVPSTDRTVQPMLEGRAVAAAENGLPIALGEALAGVGASGDVVAAARRIEAYDANPTIAAFPTGDYAALMQYAAQANGLFGTGGTTFRGAGADIIRTYFEYLAAGNAGGNFRTAYAQVLLNYLDLLRSGVLPSSFRGATQAQLNAYLAFIGRTDGFGGLSAANQQLLDAYLAFLRTGGTPDAFGGSVTSLTTAFLNYVRAGNNPAGFTQASAGVVAQYLAIVQSGGLKTNLTAQNQALLAAYLANNGIGFAQSYATGLAAFVAYLNAGGLPSAYAALPAATVRQYLETLETTGLFDQLLGAQAGFLRSYLTFLRGGGTADQFNALPINVARVNAAGLSAYVDYLLAGGAPTAYTALTQAQIRAALDQLTATGQFSVLLGQNAAFLNEYYAYLKTGADPDTFAGLPSVDVNAYASALTAFAAYLRAGNLPSGYAGLTAQQIRSYLTALQVGGKLTLLGGDAALLGDYLAYIRTGGAPDQFAGLPIVTYQGYATALAAYLAYLNAGGLPSGYTALSQAQVRAYLDVLKANNVFTLLGGNATFYTDYLAYLAGGGAVDAFAGLPIVTYQGYASALAAYYAYLNGGGLPSGYTALSQAQVRAYLDALSANAQLTALLGQNAQFFTAYRTYLAGGGSADAYAGLPIVTYQGYATALAAYYSFLAGGGAPTAYTALTQAQIRSYLDALKAAGQVTALLGTNAAFFTQYLAFLESGGSANAYPGLPSSTYGQYAAALSAYYAYLNAGGLPSGYTQLTAAQIREYLAVLSTNNQLAALLGGNATFFADYLSFISGGGAPDSFGGLPIVTYQGYAAALSAYYTYLAGGGLPANYTKLTQAQVRAYLDALSVNAQLTALLGQNAQFFTAYYAYLAGGGAPNDYAGLPATTYAQYGNALQAFVAFLRGNGLPGSYAALTSAQIREYLAVLQANGQIGLVGSAADQQLLTAYAAFLASGGLPNQFQGLPAFVTYEAGLKAYYAYLQGGGKPSGYAALTAAQAVAWFQALNAAGLATTKFSSAEFAFLRDYTTYLAGGGAADQYPGLPGNKGPTVPTVTQGLANAPRGSQANLGLAVAGKGLATSAGTSGNVVLTGDRVTAFSGAGSTGATAQSAQTVEARTVTVGTSTMGIARLSGGTYNTTTTVTAGANEGAHLVWGAPATQLPSAGVVTYGLVTATQPTVEGGAIAPGSFVGNLAVHTGTRRVGWDSVISIGGTSYRFASVGGIAAPAMDLTSALTFSAASSTQNNGLSGTATGFLSGAGAPFAGMSYSAALPSGAGTVTGAAIFGSAQAAATLPAVTWTGEQPGGGGLTQTPFAYVAGLPTTGVRARTIYVGQTSPSTTYYNGTGITQSAGGAVDRIGTTGSSNDVTRGTAKNADVAGDARVVVGRWYDGGYTRGSTANTLTANQSLHYALSAPMTFTVPYLGRIDYSLLAATQPTFAGGQTGAGLFDAKMAILLASSPKVALEGTIKMPETGGTVTYAFTTPGGIANAAQASAVGEIGATGFGVTAALTGTGIACQSATTCTLRFEGNFAGADPLRVGGTYYTTASGGISSTTSITGAAAFAGSWTGGAQSVTTVSDRSFIALAPGNDPLNPTSGSYDIDAAGRVVGITNFNGLYDRLGSATISESGQLAGGLIGWTRWTNGTLDIRRNGVANVALGANTSYQIIHGAPLSAVPTSGTVNFTLAGATAPTDYAGTRAPGQLLSGSAAVTFGATRKVALDLTAQIGGATYNLFTAGKIAGIAGSEITYDSTGKFSNTFGAGGQVSGGDCTATSCRPIWNGFLAGAGATGLGVHYQVQNTVTQARFGGVAAFEKAATQDSGGGGSTGTAGTYSNQIVYAFGNGAIVEQGGPPATVVYQADAVKSYTTTQATRTAGLIQESGRLSDVIGWARWTGDTAGPLTNQGPNQGLHVLAGTPTTANANVPTGTVQYAVVGGTKPTLSNGSAAPGSITGNLAVQFGSTPRVGFDLTMTVGQYGWNIKTTGGAADPSQSQVSYGSGYSFGMQAQKGVALTGTNAASCTGTCTGYVNGQMFGANASHVGLGVNVFDGTLGASGVVVFGRP